MVRPQTFEFLGDLKTNRFYITRLTFTRFTYTFNHCNHVHDHSSTSHTKWEIGGSVGPWSRVLRGDTVRVSSVVVETRKDPHIGKCEGLTRRRIVGLVIADPRLNLHRNRKLYGKGRNVLSYTSPVTCFCTLYQTMVRHSGRWLVSGWVITHVTQLTIR